jgi:N utilization substance protein B
MDLAERQLLQSLDRILDLAVYHFSFICELVNFAEHRIEENKLKHLPSADDLNPNTRFIDNTFIRRLRENRSFVRHVDSLKISWKEQEDIIRKIYQQLRDTEPYKTYMSISEASFKSDKEFIQFIFDNLVFNSEVMQFFYEEKNLYWTNDSHKVVLNLNTENIQNDELYRFADKEMAQKLYKRFASPEGTLEITCEEAAVYPENDYNISGFVVHRIIKEFKESWDEFTSMPHLLKPTGGEDDDREFLTRLFRQVVIHKAEYAELISSRADNWEFDRIALMDTILMQMALAELIEFPSIPVKVTMNEYIELSKIYSTPKSSQFINGLLDKLVNELKSEGKIKKTGRGLME